MNYGKNHTEQYNIDCIFNLSGTTGVRQGNFKGNSLLIY